MKHHLINISEVLYDEIIKDEIHYVITEFDKFIQKGDIITLHRLENKETSIDLSNFSSIEAIVTHVLPGGLFGIDSTKSIVSFKKIKI